MVFHRGMTCPFSIITVGVVVATNNNIVIAAASPNNAAFSTTTLSFPQQRRRRSISTSAFPSTTSGRSTTAIASSLPSDVAAAPLLEYVANTAASATETALEYVSSTVARETIHRAPILSLTISFILGGIFFSTIAAAIAGVIALGKENTRRLKEVVAIVIRRNWSVMKLSMTFTMVRQGRRSLFVMLYLEQFALKLPSSSSP